MDQSVAPAAEVERRLLGAPYRTLFLATMFLVCCLNFADRAVISVLAQAIKVDLQLTDLQLGVVQGLAFALLYASLGIPLGRLAERTSRVRLAAIATAVWSAMTVLSGMAQGFMHLLIARAGVGMGEAGFLPPTSSLVGDHFPARRRASAMSVIMLGTPLGTLAGALVAGWATEQWSWRAAFYVLGVPGLLVALFVALVLREPRRGLVDNLPRSPTPPPNLRAFMHEALHRRALRYVTIGGALAGFGIISISAFLPAFLARVHHMSIREAGALFGVITAISVTAGLLSGALTSDWIAQRDRRWSAWIATIALGSAPLVYWVGLSSPARIQSVVILTVAGSLLMMYYAPVLGMIQNLLEPRMRATGVALFTTLYTLVGGAGSSVVGFLSDRFAQAGFGHGDFLATCPGGIAPRGSDEMLMDACRSASASGVQHGLMVAVSVFLLGALCFYMASRTLREDLFVAPTSG